MCEQVVREEDGLGPLQVRVPREVRVAGVLGPREEHLLELVDASDERGTLASEVEPDVERDLVVAATARVELGPRRPRDLGDAALDRGVDVLVAGLERERPAVELLPDAVERVGDGRGLLAGEQPDPGQHRHVRA